jgi:hypothetical protein
MNKDESIKDIGLFTDADTECMKSFSHLAEMIAGLIGHTAKWCCIHLKITTRR